MSQIKNSNSIEEPQMVYVPAGPFLMGTSEDQVSQLAQRDDLAKKWQEKGYFSREQPQHTISLKSFYIAKYPVTVEQYQKFIYAGGYQQNIYWTSVGWAWRESVERTNPAFWNETQWTGEPTLPVVGVSWYEAVAYCRWLSSTTGRYYRLPSEAEWEKAARGEDGRLYPWGNEFSSRLCNTRANVHQRTLPVLRHILVGASPYGCADMAGNASEWTLSQFQPYPYNGQDGREDEEGDFLRVIRGGSWFKPELRARTASRGMNDPHFSDTDVGFRFMCEDLAREIKVDG